MNQKEYSARVLSPAWKDFASQCRTHGGNICHMCASPHGIQCHHMRYRNLGNPKEWKDIVLLCERCHEGYHAQVPVMPRHSASRLELLGELAKALMRARRDVSYFLEHGEVMNDHWLSSKIIASGLVAGGARGRAKKPKRVRKVPTAGRAFNKPRKPKSFQWEPNTSQFTLRQAQCFIADPTVPIFNSPEFHRKFQTGESRPKQWRKHLSEALRLKFNLF